MLPLINRLLLPKIILIMLLMLGSILFVASAAFFIKSSTNDEITIALPRQPAFALMYVADKEGYFWREGLSVTYRTHLLGRDALQDVSNNSADVAAVFDIPVIRKLYEGESLNVFTTIHTSTTNHMIVSLKQAGISEAADLRGKRIAFNQGTSSDYFLSLFLETNGMSGSDVIMVDVPPMQLIAALENGSVDAAVLYSPYKQNFMKNHPPEEINLLQNDSYGETSLLTAKADYASQNRKTLIKLMNALSKAETFIQSNPDQAMIYVHQWLPELSLEDIRSSWNTYRYSMRLSNSLLMNLEREALFLKNAKIYSTDLPDIRNAIITDYLEEVAPERVTIY